MLSWLIYLADVSRGINTLFAMLCMLSCIGVIMSFVIIKAENETDGNFRQTKQLILSALVFAVLASIVPSRETVLMIAASEIGERTITSQTAQGMVDPGLDLLKVWIKQKTEELNKSGK
jgi:hypothetical protein